MKIVVDVNSLVAALLKDSTCRNIIITAEQDFCFPEPSLHKIRKYKEYILEKTGFSEFEFLVILHSILSCINIIPTEKIKEHWAEAKSIMEHIDPEDVTIIAAALSQEHSIIWSDDKHFDLQERIFHLKTKDLLEIINRQN